MWNRLKKSVLVPLDLGSPDAEALEVATSLAESQDAVYALFVVPPAPAQATLSDTHNYQAQVDLDQTRAALAKQVSELGYPNVNVHAAFGPVGPTVVDYIEERSPELVVMPCHGRRGIKRLVLGSVTEYVLRRTNTPVLVLPHADNTEQKS